jgi:hypothetical protein
MAEKIFPQNISLNQFRNRNIINGATITATPNINIPTDMMEMVMNASNILYNLTSSVSQISQSLDTQSIQINNLSLTSNTLNSSKIFVNKETPSGQIDGSNTRYTLSHKPTPGSDHLYLNGILIEDGTSTDYIISGSVITFSEPLLNGSKLLCTYYYADETPLKVFRDKEIPSGSINGVNKIFILQYLPVEGSEHIYLNGVLQENGDENDYVISDSTITFKEAPPINVKLRCTYYYML